MPDLKISELTTTTDPDGLLVPGARAGSNFKLDVGAIQTDIDDHIADTAGAHAASAISFTPIGGLSATNVSDALEELDVEKQPLDSDLTAIAGLSPSNDDVIQRKAGAWTNRTLQQFRTDNRPLIAQLYSPSSTRVDGSANFYGARFGDSAAAAWGTNKSSLASDKIIGAASISIYVTAIGSNEPVSLVIRVNNTTNHTIGTLDYSQCTANGMETFNFTGLNISILSTDDWEILETIPTMTTNPTNVRINLKLYE